MASFLAACDPVALKTTPEDKPVYKENATFTCVPNSQQQPSRLQRLTKFELQNTLKDLVGPNVFESVQTDFENLPADNISLDFDTVDRAVFADHVSGFSALATRLAQNIVDRDQWLTSLAGVCAMAAPISSACVTDFIRAFGLRAFRSPMTDARLQEIKADLWDGLTGYADKEKWQMLISYFLQSPEFIYRVELGDNPDTSEQGLFKLDAYQLANRLAFLLWGRMPDDELFQVAASGELLLSGGFETQIKRMVDSPNMIANFRHFTRQWLGLDQVPISNFTLPFLSHESLGNITAEAVELVRGQAIGEILDIVTYYAFYKKNGSYLDLMTTDLAMASDMELATLLYGLPKWNKSFDDKDLVHFSDPIRKGILSRAALLIEENEKSRPVLRGVYIKRRILCDDIPSPNPSDFPNGAFDPPPGNPSDSTRVSFEKRTSPVACMSCHNSINPLGFVYEIFDPLGRIQHGGVEKLYDSTGNVIGMPRINTRVHATISFPETVTLNDPGQMNETIGRSVKGPQCLVKKWYRYTQGREEKRDDGCLMGQLHDALTKTDGGLKAMILETARLKTVKFFKQGP